jgi:hypothetical protein
LKVILNRADAKVCSISRDGGASGCAGSKYAALGETPALHEKSQFVKFVAKSGDTATNFTNSSLY